MVTLSYTTWNVLKDYSTKRIYLAFLVNIDCKILAMINESLSSKTSSKISMNMCNSDSFVIKMYSVSTQLI